MKFAVVGDAFVDGMLGPISNLPRWGHDVQLSKGIEWLCGGSSVNTVLQLKCFGHDVEWYGAVGMDSQGELLKKTLENAGVVWKGKILSNVATGTCFVLVGTDDRAFLTHNGATAEYTLDRESIEQLKQMDHVHFGGYYCCRGLHDQLPEVCSELKAAGVTISLDPNGDADLKWVGIQSVWPYISVLLPNEIEACGMTETESIESALERLSILPPISIVTCGANGVFLCGRDHEGMHRRDILPIDRIVDATGAGDAFDAGFLHGWKTSNGNIEQGLHFALAMAYFSLQQRGASNVRPKSSEIENIIQQHFKV